MLIELHARKFKREIPELESITREVMNLVQKLKRKVAEEDDIKKGIFAPVDNYLIVEKLRSDRDKAVKRAKLIEEKLEAKLVQSEEERVQLLQENQLLKEQKVAESSDIKKGIFAPIENNQIVEKLRSEREQAIKKAKLLERENQLLKEQLKQLEKK